jgi:transcriptional regulator with XRE-family HTH domain
MFENLGKALSLIREIRGKSQAQAAREAGVNKSQLSKYESGKELPKFDSLTKVLKALEVGPFEIFYTMHLIDLQAAQLDLQQECKAQRLPPLTLAGKGLLSDQQDAAFQRLLDDVMSLYNSVFLETLSKPPRRN